MEAKVNELADGVYRISAYVPEIAPPAGFTYNHFLVLGDEPLLFHTGLRRMFPLILAAVEKVRPARVAVGLLWPLRGRRVWRDERMAHRRPSCQGHAWADRRPRLPQ